MLLAFTPSSLMLSVTTHVSTDIAAIPLLWVVPLALYLLSFILVFSKRTILPHRLLVWLCPLVLLAMIVVLTARVLETSALLVSLHLLALFAVAMVCHGEIARDRPPAERLSTFYLSISIGGVLGGVFNALLAPVLFTTVWEYPLTLVLAAFLVPASEPATTRPAEGMTRGDVVLPLAIFLTLGGTLAVAQARDWMLEPPQRLLLFGLAAFACSTFIARPRRFGLGVLAVALASPFYVGVGGTILHEGRSFFGVYRVVEIHDSGYRLFYHGTTLHGLQSRDPARTREPLGYFHPNGPLGQVFAATNDRPRREVAVVGLGAGSTACYARPSERWTFYEIDPAVEQIAREPRYFTHLRDCAPTVRVVLGDGRLMLGRAASGQYDLMILDAYSSDALPIHLMTREALRLYFDKLSSDGLLAFNITNDRLDLEPVLAALAADAGATARTWDDADVPPEESERGRVNSKWLVIARTTKALGRLGEDSRWRSAVGRPNVGLWSDDRSAVASVLTLR
jgi:spermidine synthase